MRNERAIRKPQTKVAELLKPVPTPPLRGGSRGRLSRARREVMTGLAPDGHRINPPPSREEEFYSLRDRNGNATFERAD